MSSFTLKPFGDTSNPNGFYQLLLQHLSWLAVHNFSPTTIKKRALYVRGFALWCFERDLVTPATITKPMMEAFQRHLYRYRRPNGKPLAWSSQHLHLKEVRQFFAWLAKQNYIPFNPAAELDLPKLPRQLPKAILTDEEVDRILQQPDTTTPLGLRDRALFEVLYSTGIRRAEVCALRLEHIHVDRQVLFIHQGKGQKDRYVPIGLRALSWVARYVEHARDQLAIDPKEATLFLTIDGTPINPDSLTEYGRRYIKSAGIDKPGACHIFRHTMATLMHDAGADIRTIQAILGHEKLDTTQIYTRVGLKKLLDTHAKTHPAEQTKDEEDDDQNTNRKPS
ncbi:MAG: site-specific tyrosine recombinase XerC [Pirellulaceae bacterium]